MSARLCIIVLLLGTFFSAFAQSSEDGSTKQRKLVHKKPAASPPIDMNPPKTRESNAQDQGRGSEQQHQAAGGTFETSVLAVFASSKDNFNSQEAPTTSAQVTGLLTGITGEYGFTDQVSGGLTLVYNSVWVAYSPTDSTANSHGFGMSDPSFFVKSRFDFDSSSLRVGGALKISLAKNYEDSNNNFNFYSGGQSLDPFVGYEYYYDNLTFGARLDYQLFVGSRSGTLLNPNSVPVDITGGNVLTLTAFHEYNFSPMKIGVDFQAMFTDALSKSAPNTTFSPSSSDSVYTFEVYAPIVIGQSLTLIPKAAYGWEGSHDRITSITVWAAAMEARYAF